MQKNFVSSEETKVCLFHGSSVPVLVTVSAEYRQPQHPLPNPTTGPQCNEPTPLPLQVFNPTPGESPPRHLYLYTELPKRSPDPQRKMEKKLRLLMLVWTRNPIQPDYYRID